MRKLGQEKKGSGGAARKEEGMVDVTGAGT